MRITRLSATNWRNFKTLDFPVHERLFHVGPYASGKSNLPDLFRFHGDLAETGAGLAAALERRRGLSKARSLFARNYQRGRLITDPILRVFPRYIGVLGKVHVKDLYSKQDKATDRYIGLMLVGANGCVDLIEIKKPLQRGLLSRARSRDSHVPCRELSGAIMQARKCLFYLSEGGRDGENAITERDALDNVINALGMRAENDT
jgi:hypothetical protein